MPVSFFERAARIVESSGLSTVTETQMMREATEIGLQTLEKRFKVERPR